VGQSVTLNITVGTTVGLIVVDLVNDAAVEPDETFTVTISSPVNASISQAQGTGTILDDDATNVQFSANAVSATEGTELSLSVVRTGNTTGETFVSYATTDGTANERRDYSAALGRLRFAPGETNKTVRVLITDDVFNDDDETPVSG